MALASSLAAVVGTTALPPGARTDPGAPPARALRPGLYVPSAALQAGALAALSAGPDAGPQEDPDAFHEFRFTRAIWRDFRPFSNPYALGDNGPAWSTDFPKGDRQFMQVVQRLSGVDASPWENPIALDDPALRRYPFLYTLEMGWSNLTEEEVAGLRGYLQAGGFLVVDDFWGSRQWAQFERQMRRVLPGRPIVEVPRDHLLFRVYYDIDGDILQIPNVGYAYNVQAGIANPPTSEEDGFEAHVRGIFDDQGRLMVAINWNTDLGDAWEHAENPYYPLKFSTFACELGLNMIIYGMSQ